MKITKSDLRELAGILILANTPRSFFRALRKTDVVKGLEEHCSEAWLSEYFGKLRSRHNRTPCGVALGYAVMIALLRKGPSLEHAPDLEPYMWGEEIASMVKAEGVTSSSLLISTSPVLSKGKLSGGYDLFIQ